ncbi:hypothetical protein BDZ91DRAFT_441655 [Kalaharituber pfeilii]|nr:hypothetical protein BDZ91DRAFT_441655 [Kalaharituber pfeilii]
MPNGVMTTFLVTELLFVASGVLIMVVTVMWLNQRKAVSTTGTVAWMLLLDHFPLEALIANAALIFATALMAVPGLIIPTSRGWLKLHGWFVVICSIITLILGINEWIQTLTTRANLLQVWSKQTQEVQSLLQQEFNCCGYTNSTSPPFVLDSVCTSDSVAAAKQGCVGPFANFAERFINIVFTSAFGIVGLDFLLLLCIAMVIKRRKEQLRYRRIDEKRGMGSI